MTHPFRTLALALALSATAPLGLALAQETAGETSDDAVLPGSTNTGTTATSDSGAGLTARPFFFGAGLGLAVGLRTGGGAAFHLQEHLGYRFFGFQLGDVLDGALWAGLTFGQSIGDGGYVLASFDGAFGADFEVWDGGEIQLLVTPSVGLGGAVVVVNNGFGTFTDGAFHFQFNAQAEIVLLEGLLGIFLRPLGFDFFVNNGVGTSYVLIGGVNIRL